MATRMKGIACLQAAIVCHSTGYRYFRKSVDDALKQPGAWRKVFPEPEGDIARIAHYADLISQVGPELIKLMGLESGVEPVKALAVPKALQ